jgi:hypothetical protein
MLHKETTLLTILSNNNPDTSINSFLPTHTLVLLSLSILINRMPRMLLPRAILLLLNPSTRDRDPLVLPLTEVKDFHIPMTSLRMMTLMMMESTLPRSLMVLLLLIIHSIPRYSLIIQTIITPLDTGSLPLVLLIPSFRRHRR